MFYNREFVLPGAWQAAGGLADHNHGPELGGWDLAAVRPTVAQKDMPKARIAGLAL